MQGDIAVSLSCHLDVPPGALPASGLNVSLTRDDADALKPHSVQLGVWIGQPGPDTGLPAPDDVIRLQPASGFLAGMQYQGWVEYDLDEFGSGGAWCMIQKITPYNQRKNGTTWEVIHQTYPLPTGTISVNGLECLDNTVPYAQWSPSHSIDGNGDTPAQPLGYVPIMAWDYVDSFESTMMFRPPGAGSAMVPLKKWNWFWEWHTTRTNGLWNPLTGDNAQWGALGDYPEFPTWTRRLQNDWIVFQ